MPASSGRRALMQAAASSLAGFAPGGGEARAAEGAKLGSPEPFSLDPLKTRAEATAALPYAVPASDGIARIDCEGRAEFHRRTSRPPAGKHALGRQSQARAEVFERHILPCLRGSGAGWRRRSWRAQFDLAAEEGDPVAMRCCLRAGDAVPAETRAFQYHPF